MLFMPQSVRKDNPIVALPLVFKIGRQLGLNEITAK